METITIPKSEYSKLKRELDLLRDNKLLKRVNELIDILFEEKYNLILTDYTDDLTEFAINNEKDWNVINSGWDHV